MYVVGKSDLEFVLLGVYENKETADLWQEFYESRVTEFGSPCGTCTYKIAVDTQTPKEAKIEIQRIEQQEKRDSDSDSDSDNMY